MFYRETNVFIFLKASFKKWEGAKYASGSCSREFLTEQFSQKGRNACQIYARNNLWSHSLTQKANYQIVQNHLFPQPTSNKCHINCSNICKDKVISKTFTCFILKVFLIWEASMQRFLKNWKMRKLCSIEETKVIIQLFCPPCPTIELSSKSMSKRRKTHPQPLKWFIKRCIWIKTNWSVLARLKVFKTLHQT